MKSIKIKLLGILLPFLFCTCKHQKQTENWQEKYPNVLSIHGIPKDAHDLSAFGFSDQGAWHAYSLPPQDSTQYYGGFVGPLSMKMWGKWLSKSFCKMEIFDLKKQQKIDLSNAKAEFIYYPGKLVQKLQLNQLKIDMELIFVSKRSSLIRSQITNTGNDELNLQIAWNGKLFQKGMTVSESKERIKVNFDQEDRFFQIYCDKENTCNISADQLSYQMKYKNSLPIPVGQQKEICVVHSYYFTDQEAQKEQVLLSDYCKSSSNYFSKNQNRWNQYLRKIFEHTNSEHPSYDQLKVKCIETLLSNWRSPAGDLKYNGIFPSAAYHGFYGFWSWDSWKQAVALVRFHPELAKNNIRSMFQYQDEMGMVADCVYFDPKENNWRDTKAPLSAWAVYEIYQHTQDLEFVKELYPKLIKYHQWWYQYRDHDQNGLCEYGSTDGTLIAAKWESGMDNAVRFDSTKMLKNNEHAWSMNQESVDLNAYLYAEKKYLSKLSKIIGKLKQAKHFSKTAEELKQRISQKFWDEKSGFFYDREIKSEKLLTVQQGPEGWTALYTGIANQKQAEKVKNILCNPEKFACKVPFPTLVADHPKFNPLKGYWRGPVWIDQAYFGIKALENYGFHKEAKHLKNNLFSNAEGLLQKAPIRENYHPITGKGLNAKHFSWSAAHYLLLME